MRRSRARFADGDVPLVLATERFHFFRRYKLRGVKHVLFYAPPGGAHFYAELVSLTAAAAAAGAPTSVTTLFARADAAAVERVVGTARAGALLAPAAGGEAGDAAKTFVFVNA